MRRSAFVCVLLLAAGVGAAESWRSSAFSDEPGRRFDFWIGEWDVNLRIRQPDLSWKDSIAARAEIYPVLDGKAVLELWDSVPIKGFSLRYFDPEKEKWVLWLNWPGENRSGSSSLEGTFRHGRGDFFSSVTDAEGATTLSRYSFNDIGPDSLRWDDAYSRDGGKTWTHNWVMEFTRTAAEPAIPTGETGHTFDGGGRCDREEFRRYEYLAGTWRGHGGGPDTPADERTPAVWRGVKVLDGCALLIWGEYPTGDRPVRSLAQLTFNTHAGQYELLELDNLPGTPARLLYGPAVDDAIELFHRASRDAEPDYKLVLSRHEDGSFSQDMYRPDPDAESGWQAVGGVHLSRQP